MGVGHVPTGPFRQERQSHDVPGREHRGTRADLGALGERLAAGFLHSRGATIIDRNVRVGRGELDLIVSFGGRRVAVEVKAATGDNDPMDHFDEEKRRRVRRLAAQCGIGRVDYVGVLISGGGATVRWVPCVC